MSAKYISKCRTVLCAEHCYNYENTILNKATLMYASTHFTKYDGLCNTLSIELICMWWSSLCRCCAEPQEGHVW